MFDPIMYAMMKKNGVGLPVVEIADPSAITKDEGAKLTACIGMPIIVKTSLGTGPVSIVAHYMYALGHSYTANIASNIAMISYNEGADVWEARL